MVEPHAGELRAFLRAVRRRWRTAAALRGLARVIGAGSAGLGIVLVLDRFAAPADLPLLAAAAAALLAAAAFALRTFWPLRRPPGDRQVARYVEERCPELEDRLVSAAGLPAGGPAPFRALVLRDAARAVRRIALDRTVPARRLRRALLAAVAAAAVAAVVVFLGSPALVRIARSAWLHAVPFGAAIEVEPGDARVVAGEPLVIRARLRGTPGEPIRTLPAVTVARAGAGPEVLMMRRAGDGYQVEVPAVRGSFTYHVSAGAVASPDYAVTPIHPPGVERIDVAYRYPEYLGLAARVDTGGDVHAPEGTAVTVTVVADKPIRSGALRMASGAALDLERSGDRRWAASFDVLRDDSFRVALVDADALTNDGDDARYLIRTVIDRPPEVRIERPGGDREITPLEETVIEARADDDFGVDRFELVYAVAGRDERAVDLLGARRARDVMATHTLYAESLGVRPGDVVSYYVRARDTNAARPARETRSDIFFLEVRPFGREFSEAGSQFMAAMDGGDMGRLVRGQKEIVIATWRLDARPAAVRPADDVDAVAATQDELRRAASRVAADREGGRRAQGSDGLAHAIEAMRAAAASLRANDTAAAIPSEMTALNGLLQAQAEVRRTQVSLQPPAGGAFGPQPREDLSALFDRELRREQRTNYEDRAAATPPAAAEESAARRRVRELADRQEALNREADRAQENAGDDPQALRRTLERLTREQEELRRQMEDVERLLERMSNAAGGSRGAPPAGAAGGRIADRMREAQDALRRRDASAATRAGQEVADRLRDLTRELGAAGDGGRARAIRDLEAEARRMADAQRRTALASRLAGGDRAGRASRRALAGERDELAERVERFETRLDAQRSDATGAVRRALDEAAGGLAEAGLAARLRDLGNRARAAAGGRASATPDPDAVPIPDEDDSVAEELDRVGVRLRAAARAAGEAARAGQELERQIARIDRAIERMAGGADGEHPGAAEAGALAAAGGALAGRLGQSGDLAERARAVRPSLVEDLRRWAEHAFSGSAPGTEAFKQDRAEWESLREDVRLAIGRFPASGADAAAPGDGLHVGPDERIPESYRRLVERYYRSLAERP